MISNNGLSLSTVILPGLFCIITMKETANYETGKLSKRSDRKTPPVRGMRRNRRGFQHGHPHFEAMHGESTETPDSHVWMPRLGMADFSRVVQETSGGLLTVPDADGRPGNS